MMPPRPKRIPQAAAERGGNTLKGFQGLSRDSQDQNPVLTALYVPSSLDSGTPPPRTRNLPDTGKRWLVNRGLVRE